MDNLSRNNLAIGLLFVCFIAAGCKNTIKIGHYEGTLFRRFENTVTQEPVKIEVSSKDRKTLVMSVNSLDGMPVTSASVRHLKNHHVEITAPLLSKDPIHAAHIRSEQIDPTIKCYANYGTISIELCFRDDQFLLQAVNHQHIPFVQLSANLFKTEEPFSLEDPVSLNLSDAVKLSFKKNFDSRLAFERVIQARNSAMAAYLNLVPHLSSNLIWDAAPNYITYIATVQALASFLLPSYWLQAREAVHDSRIKDLALIIMRANLATTIEELAYSFQRDSMILERQREFLEKLGSFEKALAGSNLNQEPREKLSEFCHFLIEAITSDIGDMTKLVQQDRFSLAQALGFQNMEAVKSISIDQELLPIEQARLLDPLATANLALDRSFELTQLDELRRIAELKKVENLFVWMDPTGDPKQGFGLNLIPQQRQAKSQIREIEIQRQQMKASVHQGAYKLALDYNEAIESYNSIQKNVDQTRFDLDQILVDAIAGQPIDLSSLKSQAQKFMASQIAIHTSLANFRIARAKRDRYLLAGYYTELLPQVYFSTTRTSVKIFSQ